MTELPKKKLLRVDEVAAYFSVEVETIRRWVEHGHLIARRPGSGRIMRITHESVLKCELGNQRREKM